MIPLKVTLILAVLLIVCVQDNCAKGGGRGGGGRGGSRGGGCHGGWSWGGSKSSSTSHSSPSSSKGNWFSNLFSSKSSSSSSSGSSSASSSSGVPKNSYPKQPDSSHSNYPKQPAYNPSYTDHHTHNTMGGRPPPYSQAGHDMPPSYGSLFPGRSSSPGHGQTTNNFGMFHPQNNVQSSNSYHFIPVFVPHYGYNHYHGHSYYGTRHQASSTDQPETYTTPAPITSPIVMDMKPQAAADDAPPVKPSLVVAVNNMVLYGDYRENTHVVMVIDEHYEDPGEIPAKFLVAHENDGPTDYFPRPITTTTTPTPDIQIYVQYHNGTIVVPNTTTSSTSLHATVTSNNATTTLPATRSSLLHNDSFTSNSSAIDSDDTIATPTVPSVYSTTSSVDGEPLPDSPTTRKPVSVNEKYGRPEMVLDMQFFSDVDGAN